MTMIQGLARCVLVIGLAGCAATGNGHIKTLTEDDAAATLVRGKTVKDEVRRALGDARVASFPSGNEVWVYQFTDGASKFVKYVPLIGRLSSTGTKVKELKILFDKDGVVKKYILQEIHMQ